VMKEITPARRHHPVSSTSCTTSSAAGAAEGAIDAASILKPALARGRAADCRRERRSREYRKYLRGANSAPRAALFQKITVDQPSTEEDPFRSSRACAIATSSTTRFAIPPMRRSEAVPPTWPTATSPTDSLPDKAIDLIDEARVAGCGIKSMTSPPILPASSRTRSRRTRRAKGGRRSRSQEFEKAANLRDKERQADPSASAKLAEQWEARRVHRAGPAIGEEEIADNRVDVDRDPGVQAGPRPRRRS